MSDHNKQQHPSGGHGAHPSSQAHGLLRRFDQLEALRGVVVVFIVVYHVYQHALITAPHIFSGAVFAPLLGSFDAAFGCFFVMSGFLVFLPYARVAIDGRHLSFANNLLLRRLLRVLPLYYAAIILVWVLRYTRYPGQQLDLLEHLTFAQVFDKRFIFWTIGPAWILAIEVQFCLLILISGWLSSRLCRFLRTPRARVTALSGAVLLLLLGSVVYKLWMAGPAGIPLTDYPTYYDLLAKADTLAMGMLIAIAVGVSSRSTILRRHGQEAVALSGILIFSANLVAHAVGASAGPLYQTIAGAAFALVLAALALGPASWGPERLATARPLCFLGLVSYSVLIWHEPLLIRFAPGLHLAAPQTFATSTLVILALSVAVASLSYWTLEFPATFLRYIFTADGHLANHYEHHTPTRTPHQGTDDVGEQRPADSAQLSSSSSPTTR
jgi:peptidoglycan/LPS O-acetylase OafA/YrhL